MDSFITKKNNERERQEPLLNDILTIKSEFISNKNKNNKFINKDQKKMIQMLVFMGFSMEMIDMCFCFFNILTIEQAVQLMTKENDTWQHEFIKGENNGCIVCGEHCNHLNYSIDKAIKIEKLRELNESFNSKYRQNIEKLRESNGNRLSKLSNFEKNSPNANKNSQIFTYENFNNDNSAFEPNYSNFREENKANETVYFGVVNNKKYNKSIAENNEISNIDSRKSKSISISFNDQIILNINNKKSSLIHIGPNDSYSLINYYEKKGKIIFI